MWLQAAEDYREGRITAEDLKEARVAAWDYLGGRSCDFSSPGVNAIRAVIFLLFPALENDDLYENLFHFLDFCEGAGLSREDSGKRLREAFGNPDG